MAAVTMNIDSAVWNSVTFDNESIVDFDFGGDVVEHSSGTDEYISDARIVNIRGLFTVGFNDRATFLSLLAKLNNSESSMVMKIKDIDAATGLQVTAANSKLQRLLTNAQHNAPTVYSAIFYSRSTDGTTASVTMAAY